MIWYYNGDFLPEEEISMKPKTQAYHYGYGIFTSFRTNKGKAVLFDKHLARLEKGCELLGICKCQIPTLDLIEQLVAENGIGDLRIKVIISLGERGRTDLLLTCTKFIARHEAKALKIVSNDYNKTMLRKYKTVNYLENVLLNKTAVIEGFSEGLLVNSDNLLCEACFSNIFFLKDDKIITPKAEGNILNGVVRQALAETFPVIERDVLVEELASFDGAFTTNSVQGIVYVKKIDSIEYQLRENDRLAEFEKRLGLK